jgi:hypothetical protein
MAATFAGQMRRVPISFLLASLSFSSLAQFSIAQSGKANGHSGDSRLPAVHLDGQYFERDGKRFLPMGAHWVPAKAAMQWPVQWHPKDFEADFAKMHDLGYTIVRLDMLWAWFEPGPPTTIFSPVCHCAHSRELLVME